MSPVLKHMFVWSTFFVSKSCSGNVSIFFICAFTTTTFRDKKVDLDKQMFQNRWHSGSVCVNNKYKKLINHTHCNNFKNSLAIADSGCTSHFLCDASNCEDIQPAGANEITATTPIVKKIRSTHTTTLKWPNLFPSARTCHIFPVLKNKILLSIRQFCDAGYLTHYKIGRASWVRYETT